MTLMLIFIFSTSVSTAQNTRGIVLEEKSNKPVAFVNVYIKKSGIGTATNEKGEFNLNYFYKINENDTLNFSCIGYFTKSVTFSELKTNNYSVLLTESINPIEGVTITSSALLNYQIAFTRLAPLKDGLYSFGSTLIGDKIWVIGGDESNDDGRGLKPIAFSGGNLKMNSYFSWQSYSDELHIYDIQADKWITSNLKFSKRAYHNSEYYNDKIYVLGGKTLSANRKFEYLDDKIEVYDIRHNTIFTDHTNPHQAVNFATFVYNDNLIVMGGSCRIKMNEEKESYGKVHLLNLKTGYWYELNDMPIPRETSGILINNTIYLIGGFNLKPLDIIETYNIATEEWNTVGQLFYGVERPALAYNENIIYIFEDGRIQTYNIETKELNLYSIDLPLKSCGLFCAHNMLYILGGYIENEHSITPSSDLLRIDLNKFDGAVIYDAKTL